MFRVKTKHETPPMPIDVSIHNSEFGGVSIYLAQGGKPVDVGFFDGDTGMFVRRHLSGDEMKRIPSVRTEPVTVDPKYNKPMYMGLVRIKIAG